MWEKKTLRLSPSVQTALEGALRGAPVQVNLTTKGAKIAVHNWTHGITTASGRYLSPENAIKAVVAKCSDYRDSNRPRGVVETVGILLTARTIDDFIQTLTQAQALWAEPTIRQALDYAKAHRTLQADKMTKTPTITSPAFSPSTDITPSSARTLQSVMRNANATASATSADPLAAIAALKAKKAEREQQNQAKVRSMLAARAPIYAHVGKQTLEQTALSLLTNTPDASHVYTVLLFFVGNDLTALKEMIA